jgi:tellurium resistance protein TerD
MPINLTKGERVNLSKENPTLQKIKLGLSWDIKEGVNADLDASLIILNGEDNPKMLADDSLVYYNKTEAYNGAIKHSGDNKTGDGDGDDETIIIDLAKLPAEVQVLLAAITSYNKPETVASDIATFGRVKSAKVKLYNEQTNEVLYTFDLSEDASTATSMEVARLYKKDGEWRFTTLGDIIGRGLNGLEDVLNKYKK